MYMLTEDQIEHFEEKGWIGPLDTFSPSEIEPVIECLETNSRIVETAGQQTMMFYNNVLNSISPRDHHLFYKPLANLLKDPKIVRRLNQLGEPNLLLWYSNIFGKLPGQGEIKWHQAIEYYTSSDVDYEKRTLVYPKSEKALNLTVWIALDDATPENGCLRFANGTHNKRFKELKAPPESGIFAGIQAHKVIWQGEKKYSRIFEFDENEWEVEEVPAKAGQIVIFTERVMHSSGPNNSNQRRLGLNTRYIPPSVLVYPGRLKGDFIDENFHNIQRHFCILVSGRDDYGINVVRDGHDLDETEVEFQTMANLVRYGHVELPTGKQQLEIDSLYQQAMEGDCQEEEPDPILHARKYIQWQAWSRLKGMSYTEAMKQYSRLVATLPQTNTGGSKGWKEHYPDSTRNNTNARDARKGLPKGTEIQDWLVSYLAELLKIEPTQVDVTIPFDRYSIESADAAQLAGDLEDWLERKLSPTLLYNYPTIEALVEYLAEKSIVKV